MPLRPTITTVDGVTTVGNLLDEIELDPQTIGTVDVFEVFVTVAESEYRVVGFNAGNGYLKAKKVK